MRDYDRELTELEDRIDRLHARCDRNTVIFWPACITTLVLSLLGYVFHSTPLFVIAGVGIVVQLVTLIDSVVSLWRAGRLLKRAFKLLAEWEQVTS